MKHKTLFRLLLKAIGVFFLFSVERIGSVRQGRNLGGAGLRPRISS